jgi:hypothetical protein
MRTLAPVFLAAVLLSVLQPPSVASAQQAPVPATVRVSAEATVSGKPDLGVLDLGVVSEARTADAAAGDNARKMERIVASLKKEVGAGGEVKTADYSVEQRYGEAKTPGQRPPIVGYVVTNTVRVKVPDPAAVGKLIDQALKLGANEVRSLAFTFKDAEPLRAEALRAAAARARARAGVIASALGVKLGPLVSASDAEEGGRPIPMAFQNKVRTMAAAETPVEVGTLEVSATVTLVFATAGR